MLVWFCVRFDEPNFPQWKQLTSLSDICKHSHADMVPDYAAFIVSYSPVAFSNVCLDRVYLVLKNWENKQHRVSSCHWSNIVYFFFGDYDLELPFAKSSQYFIPENQPFRKRNWRFWHAMDVSVVSGDVAFNLVAASETWERLTNGSLW